VWSSVRFYRCPFRNSRGTAIRDQLATELAPHRYFESVNLRESPHRLNSAAEHRAPLDLKLLLQVPFSRERRCAEHPSDLLPNEGSAPGKWKRQNDRHGRAPMGDGFGIDGGERHCAKMRRWLDEHSTRVRRAFGCIPARYIAFHRVPLLLLLTLGRARLAGSFALRLLSKTVVGVGFCPISATSIKFTQRTYAVGMRPHQIGFVFVGLWSHA
jgi:hypothetical protein